MLSARDLIRLGHIFDPLKEHLHHIIALEPYSFYLMSRAVDKWSESDSGWAMGYSRNDF
jgi:hypothetical protein